MRGAAERLAGRLAGRPAEGPTLPFDAGSAFVLAAGGLRRLRGRGEALAGYVADELFWRDLLGLVHEGDLPGVGSLLSEVAESRRTNAVAAVARLRGASGGWMAAELTMIRRVFEASDDAGLVVAHVHAPGAPDAPSPDGRG